MAVKRNIKKYIKVQNLEKIIKIKNKDRLNKVVWLNFT